MSADSEAEGVVNFDEYQAAAMRTANPECVDLSNSALGMCGEAGEFADCVKKHLHQGHALDHAKLVKEAGDVLWYIALACQALGVSMEGVALANIEKLRKRYPESYSHADSINRKDVASGETP